MSVDAEKKRDHGSVNVSTKSTRCTLLDDEDYSRYSQEIQAGGIEGRDHACQST